MRKLIPLVLHIVPRKHLIRLSYVFMRISALFYRGNNVECPVCGSTFKKFLPYGHNIVRKNVLCPKCLSLERHRLIWLFLKNKTDFFSASLKVLHVAPEQCFIGRFKKLSNLNYITADLESPIADIKLDVQQMPFKSNEFDVVICNHVLEHVEDDTRAMSEILRVLKKGGFAILHVPVDFAMKTTREDPGITDPLERERLFRQKDHYRFYGTDYPERLKKVGFIIKDNNYLDMLDETAKDRYRLMSQEFMYAYYK
ncbi:MAG: class I SAM-dependent methyltransferase [Bacteroidales bacterium]|nr:class I SAM-dependent methyltransferase [Bacteroidales bacterium]